MAQKKNEPDILRVLLAAALAWLLPGLGHVYLGQRLRGLILIVVITATFWCGVAVGGVQSTIQPRARKAWFMAQMCTGSHALAALGWGELRSRNHPDERAGYTEEDIAVIYTGIAGLLSVLIIIDTLASADPNYVRLGPTKPNQEEESR